MQVNFTEMSLDANPLFAVESQNRIAERERSEQRGRRLFIQQADCIQCLGPVIRDLSHSPQAFLFWCTAVLGERRPGVQYSAANSIIDQFQASAGRRTRVSEGESIWTVLKSLIGTVDAPPDWAAEHDHYLYGTPKKGADRE